MIDTLDTTFPQRQDLPHVYKVVGESEKQKNIYKCKIMYKCKCGFELGK